MKSSRKPETNVMFSKGEWGYVGTGSRGTQRLTSHNKKNTTRMFVAGEYIPKSHPNHVPGRFTSWKAVKYPTVYVKPEPIDPILLKLRKQDKAIYAESDNKQSILTEGFVYVMTHPKLGTWSKVGHSRDPQRRLSGYNTGCPYREYVLHGFEFFSDRKKVEKDIHSILENEGLMRQGEWFQCPPEYIIEKLRVLVNEEF